jgi:hypothetical protein
MFFSYKIKQNYNLKNMKAKLLKKVRKRFSIIRIDELGSSPCSFYVKCNRMFGLPFFYIQDENQNDYLLVFEVGFKTLEAAMIGLNQRIIRIYGESFRHKDEVYSKVWYKK